MAVRLASPASHGITVNFERGKLLDSQPKNRACEPDRVYAFVRQLMPIFLSKAQTQNLRYNIEPHSCIGGISSPELGGLGGSLSGVGPGSCSSSDSDSGGNGVISGELGGGIGGSGIGGMLGFTGLGGTLPVSLFVFMSLFLFSLVITSPITMVLTKQISLSCN